MGACVEKVFFKKGKDRLSKKFPDSFFDFKIADIDGN